MRAVHGRCDPSPLISDPHGDRFLTDAERPFVLQRLLLALPEARRAAIAAMTDPGAAFDAAVRHHPAYAGVVVRARFAEDALLAAVRRGIRQYVAVAAGLDTFAVRHPEFADCLRVVEVDHPATQEMKRQRFAVAGIDVPRNVELLAADLQTRTLREVLAGSGFDPALPAFFSVLGLTPYLTQAANLALLGSIAAAGVAGIEVVLDYLDVAVVAAEAGADGLGRLASERAQTDEPWVCGFEPREVAGILGAIGLQVTEDADGVALQLRYGVEWAGENGVPPQLHLVRARTGDRGA